MAINCRYHYLYIAKNKKKYILLNITKRIYFFLFLYAFYNLYFMTRWVPKCDKETIKKK